MKTYQEFMQESSLSRIKSKSDKGGMAIISGSRGDKSSKENKARAKQLDKDIRGKGLPGATKVSGRWDEKDDKTGKTTKVKERSHVVTSGKKGKRKFKKAVKVSMLVLCLSSSGIARVNDLGLSIVKGTRFPASSMVFSQLCVLPYLCLYSLQSSKPCASNHQVFAKDSFAHTVHG